MLVSRNLSTQLVRQLSSLRENFEDGVPVMHLEHAAKKKFSERGYATPLNLKTKRKNTLVPAQACELMDLGVHSSLKDRKSKCDGLNGLGRTCLKRVCERTCPCVASRKVANSF